MERKEPKHHGRSATRLNALRAAVLGADDGIVSVAGIVVGVAGATTNRTTILTAGVAGLVAGALSMAAGEYVSVSSQKDSEKAILAREKEELKNFPEEEFEELVGIYRAKGLTKLTARQVAKELSAHDVFRAHAEAELRIDPDELNNPWHAAIASAASFVAGAIIPVLATVVSPDSWRITVTVVAVVIALCITGAFGAYAGGASKLKGAFRVVLGGLLAMAVTYAVGRLFGQHGI